MQKRKVYWPAGKSIIKDTVTVLIVVTTTAGFLALVDVVLRSIIYRIL